ncbi:MAG TPA: DUF86 domain-containing protein [Thermomicrobiales bacterium]|jgi:uncharacterized protein with HEPN domain|nr:DUF86 domain-containing protein [Thermomicrobiales bacterium]
MNRLIENALLDVYEAAIELDETVREMSIETYLVSRPVRRIVERLLEVIGEAVGRAEAVDPVFVASIVDVRAVTGMRNRIAHGYDQLDHTILWRTATVSVPLLRAEIEQLLSIEPEQTHCSPENE